MVAWSGPIATLQLVRDFVCGWLAPQTRGQLNLRRSVLFDGGVEARDDPNVHYLLEAHAIEDVASIARATPTVRRTAGSSVIVRNRRYAGARSMSVRMRSTALTAEGLARSACSHDWRHSTRSPRSRCRCLGTRRVAQMTCRGVRSPPGFGRDRR